MKTVIIIQEYVPSYRHSFFTKLIELAADSDIAIRVVAGQPSGDLAHRGDSIGASYIVPALQKELRILGRRFTIRRIWHEIRSADLVIFEQARRNAEAYGAFLPRLLRTRKFAMWGHGRDYVQAPGRFSRILLRGLTNRMDWFFAYTSGGKDAVVSHGFPDDRVTCVMNSIDVGTLQRELSMLTLEDLDAFRFSLGLEGRTAVYIGGLDNSKRIDFLMEAGRLLHQMEPRFRLLVVGDGVLAPDIKRIENEEDWLRYLGASQGRIKALALSVSDVMTNPGRVGLVALDSLASGTPIITTNWLSHAPEFEYLEQNRTCIVTQNNVHSYVSSVIALMVDNHRLQNMTDNCRSESVQYSIDLMANNFLDGIKRALRL